MRCNALRCTGCDARTDALRAGCDAMRCAALHGARIVCDAIRCAGWLHSRGAGGAMLFTEGFLGWGVWADGWAEGWVGGVMPIYVLPASCRWSHSLPR
jgi:hypothetical protein